MPASIERSIREENLKFMQNRDVFSEDYYSFLYEVKSITLLHIRVDRFYMFSPLFSLQVPTAAL